MKFKSAMIKDFKRFTHLSCSRHSRNGSPYYAGWTERQWEILIL